MSNWQSPEATARLNKRYAAERRFKLLGLAAIVLSMLFLAVLLFTMLKNGISGLDWSFLSGSDSTDPSTAGVWSAVKGSILTMLVNSFGMQVELLRKQLELLPFRMMRLVGWRDCAFR